MIENWEVEGVPACVARLVSRFALLNFTHQPQARVWIDE